MDIEQERHSFAKRLLTVAACLMLGGGSLGGLVFLSDPNLPRAALSFATATCGALGLFLARTDRLPGSLLVTCLVTFAVMTEAHVHEAHSELAPLYAAPVALLAVVVLRRTGVVMVTMLVAVVVMRVLRLASGIVEESHWLHVNGHVAAILLLWTVLMLWVIHRDERARSLLDQAVRRGEELRAKAQVEADQALSGSAAKSRFLAAMSHQLRTPLNAVRGYAELVLEDGEGDDDSIAEDLGRIISASDLLLSQVDEVLDVSKVESGRLELEVVSIDLAKLVDEAVSTVEPLARAGGCRVVVVGAEAVGGLVSDPGKVRQVLLNLLSNACKFTHRGTITVGLSGDADTVWIEVSDTGIGIAPEALDDLFRPFTQAGGVDHRGTGLGLALCVQFVEVLGGSIAVESELGKGSTFRVVLPREAPAGAAEAAEVTPSGQRRRVLEAFAAIEAERLEVRTVWFQRVMLLALGTAALLFVWEVVAPTDAGTLPALLAAAGSCAAALLARWGRPMVALWTVSVAAVGASWILHLTEAGDVAVLYPIALPPLIALVAPRAFLGRGLALCLAAFAVARGLRWLEGADPASWSLITIDVGVVAIGTTALVLLVERQAAREAQLLGQAAFDREALQAQFHEMARAARSASAAKDRFLAAMSHELRTPLGAIIGYTELLQDELGPEDVRARDLARIHGSSTHLLRIVDEVLDLAKANAGQLPVSLQEVDGREMLAELPVGDALPDIGLVRTDPWFVERAITCLMDQGATDVEAALAEGELRLRFAVPGSWGSQGALEARLEPFALDPSADAGGDTGVGLALARTLITRLGGSLEAEAGEGRALFTLRVPTRTPA